MAQQRDRGARVVLCTCPDQATARRLAGGLVEARLSACVNILPGVRPVFRWLRDARRGRMMKRLPPPQ